jgi:hypothetical protein
VPSQPNLERSIPKRKKILFLKGLQLRYAFLVAGSLFVLLLFCGLHGIFVAKKAIPTLVSPEFLPILRESTWRLFGVGLLYIGVVTFAAVLISHRTVGPAYRLEEEIRAMSEPNREIDVIKIRHGDEFESLVSAINSLISRLQGTKK